MKTNLKDIIRVLGILVLTLFITNTVYGMDHQTGSIVYGNISYNGNGAAHINISLTKYADIGTTTDTAGNYHLIKIPQGEHTLKISGVGYKHIEKKFKIAPGEIRKMDFYLEEDIYEIEQVVVSGSRVGILRYLPGSANTISAKELKVISPVSGNEVFRQISGVHVVEEEGAGLRANIGVRGLDPDKSRNVLILEDGIPVALAPYGEPEMYYTPSVNRMTGVEILKGSGSILYGPQTIGGVINYITADPPLESSGYVDISGGQGRHFTTLLGYGNTLENTGFQINYIRRQAENLGTTSYNLHDITSKIQFKPSLRSKVVVKLGVYDEKSNSTYIGLTQVMYDSKEGDYLRLAPHDNLDIRRYVIGVSHDFRIRENIQLHTTAFGYTTARNWRRQDFSRDSVTTGLTGIVWGDESLSGGAIYMRNSTGNRNRQFEVAGLEPRFRYNYKIGNTDNIVDAGVRILYERAFEQRIDGTAVTAKSGSLRDDEIRTGYAFSSWAQNKLLMGNKFSFTAGLRTEVLEYARQILRTNSTDVNIRNNTVTSAVIPGAGINYNFNNTSGIFAGIHRGFAPPRIKDAISNEGADLQLEAEKSWNIELGTRTKLFSFIQFELTAFYMDFSNQVIPVSESSGGAGSGYINGGRTFHRGIETELKMDISKILNIKGATTASFNSTVIESVFSGDRYTVYKIAKEGLKETVFININGNRTPYAPGLTASGNLQYEMHNGFGVRLSGLLTGKQYTDVLNTRSVDEWFVTSQNDPNYSYIQASADGLRGMLPSFFLLDVSAWYEMPGRFRLNLCVKNLLNERYIASRRPQGIRVGLPRLVNAGLSYSF